MAAWSSFRELATLLVAAAAAGIDVWEMFHTQTIANSRLAKREAERSEQQEKERGRKKSSVCDG